MAAILSSARKKVKAKLEPNNDEKFVLKLLELQQLVVKFHKIAKSESEARVLQKQQAKKPPVHTTGPISFGSEEIEIVEASEPVSLDEEKSAEQEPVVLSQEQRKSKPPPSAPAQQGSWFGRVFKNPTTWAFISISAYSARMSFLW